MAKKGRGKYYAIGGIIVVLAIIFMYGDSIDLDNIADTAGQSGINISPSQTQSGAVAKGVYQVYAGGIMDLQTNTKDSLDVTITYGDDTEIDTICWNANGSDDVDDWTEMPGGTMSEAETGDADIKISAGSIDAQGNVIDTGDLEMWCEINIESSQDYFVDQAKIIQVNDNIDTCMWVDANDDNDPTWACRYDLSDISSGLADPQNRPFDVIQLYLFDEDTDGTIMDTGVASALSVAQGDTTTELLTHLDIASASADVVVISDIYVRNNLTSTDSDLMKDSSEICFEDSTAKAVWYDTREPVGCLTLGDTTFDDGRKGFTFIQQSSTREWQWKVSDYKDGILIQVPKNEGLQVDTPFKVATAFSSATDAICVELNYKYVDAFKNKSSFDAVDIELTSASSNADECTI